MAVGWITRTGLRATAVDFSEPYFVSNVGLISRNAQNITRLILWKSVYLISL